MNDDWSMGAKNYVSGPTSGCSAEASVNASGCRWAIRLADGPNLGTACTVPGTNHQRLLQLHDASNYIISFADKGHPDNRKH